MRKMRKRIIILLLIIVITSGAAYAWHRQSERERQEDSLASLNITYVAIGAVFYQDSRGSYTGFCDSIAAKYENMECNDTETSWVAAIPLPSSGGYFCSDSKLSEGIKISAPLGEKLMCQ